MKILGVITARGGSKGIKKKNLALLRNKPLISWTINAALRSKLDDVILSSDDKEIIKYSKKLKIKVPFVRPKYLSDDYSSSIDTLIHAATTFEKNIDNKFDAFMLLQPTSPFRSIEDINNCIRILNKSTKLSSVISLVEVDGFYPERMKYLTKQNIIKDPVFCEKKENLPRQKLKKIFIRNGAIYLVRRNTLLQQKSLKGKYSYGYTMPNNRSINIDKPIDLKIADIISNEKSN
tara:strand:+ start:2518 stop:3219 length:702 start_codon:yes stop_codon:yes gene_type:complete